LDVARKNDTAAIDKFSKCIEINPTETEAYNERGLLRYKLKKYQSAIYDFNKAIENERKYAEAYYNKAKAQFELKKFTDTIESYSFAIQYNCNNKASAFNDRGVAKCRIRDYQDAINDFSEAIKINPSKPLYYKNRGVSYSNIKEYDKAIDDFNKVIAIASNNDADVYNFRGVANAKKKQYKEAIADFNEAIKIDSQHSKAFKNRGEVNAMLGNFDKAINDFTAAIDINKKYGEAYYYMAIAQNKLKNKQEVANNFNDALKNGFDVLSHYIKEDDFEDEVALIILGCKYDNNYFYSVTKNIKKQKSREMYKKIYLQSMKIKRHLLVKELSQQNIDERNYGIAHYTRKNIAESLLFSDYASKTCTKFRINSIATANDPEEGNVLLKYLNIDETPLHQNYQAFIGCFTFDAECLNQFRLYGKIDSREATGVSIVLKKDFFNDNANLQMPQLEQETDAIKNNPIILNNYPIYRCVYIDPETNQIISVGYKEIYSFYREGLLSKTTTKNNIAKIKQTNNSYQSCISDIVQKVEKELEFLRELLKNHKEKGLENDILCDLLVDIRFLVKHVAFKEEQECRIIDVVQLGKAKDIKIENNRMYKETRKINHLVKQIYFAPQTDGLEFFQDRLKYEGLNIECKRCTHPFRG
jgi:tetratricopeptide (TPR) repeat protein